LNISDYIILNDRMLINKEMEKDVDGSGHGLTCGTVCLKAYGTKVLCVQ
jgi:hypothetical protein